MKFAGGILILLTLACATARADTVTFKNGDQLSGTFISVRDGNLAFKSDALGDVTIPLGKVASFSSASPTVVVGNNKKVIRGQIALQPSGDWQVTTDGTPQTVAAGDVKVILTADSYHELVEQHSKPWQAWKGSINFGYSVQNGDQQTGTLSSAVAATRERSNDLIFARHWRTNYALTMLFAKAQQGGTTVASNTISTNLRDDYLFSSRDFIFGFGQLDHVEAQGLYLRQTAGGGVGHDLLHSDRLLFSVLGGVTFVHERFYSGPSNRTAQALIGEKIGMQISRRLRFDNEINFYPGLQHGKQYRADGNANLALKISNRLAANAGVVDLFLSNPGPGSHQNNIAFTTGLGYTF